MNSKRIISLILSILMTIQVFAFQTPVNAMEGVNPTIQKSEGQKIGKRSEVFEFKNNEKPKLSWFTTRSRSPFGARDVDLTKSEKVKIETTATGLDEGTFNWEAFGQNKKFNAWIEVAYVDDVNKEGEPIRHKVSENFEINKAGTIETNITVDASKRVDNYYIVTEYDDEPDSFNINAFFDRTTIKSDKGEKSIAFKLDVHQIVSTKIAYNLIDEYGKAIDLKDAKEEKPADNDLKGIGKIGKDISFDLKKDGTDNLWQEQGLDEFDLMDSSLTLSLTKNQVTSGGIDYKLSSTYDVLNGGKVTIQRQKDAVTPKDPKNPGDIPAGYARINLVADETGNGSKGTFTKENPQDTQRVVDVKAGKDYTTAQAEIEKQGKPFPLTSENKVDTGKTFDKWTPALDTLGTAVAKDTKNLNATYKSSDKEIIPYLPTEPAPTDDGNGLPIPTDYVTVTFKSEDAKKGNVKIGNKEGATVLAKVKPGIDLSQKAEITTVPVEHYGFTQWKPILGKAAEGQTYTAYFVKSGEEIGEKDPIPEGWFKVTVSQDDDSIVANTVKKAVYPVEPNGKLAADKFADLTNKAKDGYKDPAWYVGSDKYEKPYEVAINSSMDFVARATELESHKITKDNGLKPVDFTAYKGDKMGEDFWKKGVELKNANDNLQKLLDAAKVTDATIPERTTTEAGEKTGTLRVTFKDGSFIEVQNQKLIVIDTKVDIDYNKDSDKDANAPRHNDEVVKGKIKTSETVEGAKVEILGVNTEGKDEVIGITLAKADGSFIAGTRKLQAGETIKVRVTLPKAGKASEPVEKVVKLNADRLNELLKIAKAQKDNFSKKQNAIIKEKLEALGTAITEAEKLVDKNGKATATDTAKNQTAIDTAVTNLENALKALTANIPPTISGPKTHEIFVGEALDLEKLVEVTDGDGADDLVVENGSNVKITAVKVEKATEPNVADKETAVADLSTIKDTVGTYKVTYTAKDKSDAKVTHEMTLTVKPRTTSAIEVTKDPNKMSYLITGKDGKAKLDLTGMTLNLVDNLGKKTRVDLTDKNVTFKVNGKEIKNGGELTLADDVHFIEVEYKYGDNTLTAQTKGVLRVGPDYDGDGKDDRTQNFDPEKIEKLVVVKQPQLDYIAKDKSEADKVFKLNLEGMIVRMTDKAGKEKLAVFNEGKFVDYDNIREEIKGLTATPVNGAKLTPQTSDTDKGHNGSKVAITGPNNSNAETDPLKVFYDANKDGKPDYGQEQKTPAPSAMARNVGENPQGTTVEGMATPGAVIKITDAQGKVLTTEPKEVKAGPDGKYTATIKPMLADGTDIKVTAKLGEMGESNPTEAKVFDDKNNNKQPDKDEGFNIAKATDIKFVDQPDLTYLVAAKDTEVTFDGKDGKGKPIYLELSYKNGDKTESKIMTLEDLMKDNANIAVTPAKDTKDKIELDKEQKEGAITEHNLVGKAIEVKLVKANKTATSTSTFAIEIDADGNGKADKDEKTPAPTAKALNVGEKPTSTTITGKAVPGAKVVAKVTIENQEVVVGETTANAQTGEYTINATKDGAALPVDTKVNVTAQVGVKKVSDPTETIVKADKDGNGVADNEEDFDITKTAKIEMVSDPNTMDYLVTTQEGKVRFDATGMLVRLTDKAGKEKLYTAAELTADTTNFKVQPAHDSDLTIAANHDKKVKVTLLKAPKEMTNTEVETTGKLSVKLDANNNGVADETETTATPTVTARNIGEKPEKTTVEGTAPKGSTVTIKYTPEGGQETTKTVTAGDDGKYTADITPKLEVGKEVKVTAKDGEKKVSPEVKTQVFDDKDNDGKDDKSQNFDITKADKIEMVYDPAKMNYLVTKEDGKVALETKGMVVKVTDKAGVEKKFTAEEIAKDAKNFTVEPAGGAEIGLDKNEKPIKVTLNVESATKKETTTSNLSVKLDKDGNGVADDQEQFDIKKATKVEILQNPDKMKYSVTKKTDKTPFDAKGVIIRLTDASGKTATYNYDDIIKDENKGKFTLSPADKDEIGLKEDGSVNTIPFTVTVTGADTKPSVTAKENITVILDKDGNGVDDRTETTPEPNVIARNIGTDGPDGKKVPATKTTVEVKTEKNADVTIEYKDANGDTKTITGKADDQGKLTQEITPKLKDGTDVKVTVQDGEKKPTDKTVKVFEDLDGDKTPDTKAGQTERPAALASNIGKEPKFTTITGEAEKGATVTANVGTQVVGTATADKTTGRYTIKAKQNEKPIKEGVKIDVTATLAPKTESLKQTVVVFNDTDETGQPDSAKDFDVKKAKEMQVVASPDKMVYSNGDKLNLDGLKVLVTDVNGNKKIFTYRHADNTEFTKAGLSVDLKQGTELSSKDYNAQTAKDGRGGRKLVVTLDTTGNTQVTEAITGQTPTALTVNKNQSAQPTDVVAANQGDATVTKVKGKATKDAEIKITDDSGQSLLPKGTTIKADAKGDFTVDLNKLLNPGTKVFVTATEPGKSESPKAETPVIRDKDGNWKADTGAKLSTPVIDPIREKDEKVVVTAPTAEDKIQTIEVSDQNGKTVTLTKDPADTTGKTWKVDGSNPEVKVKEENGKIAIPVKGTLPLNDRDQIKVTFKDGENPANEAFDKAPVQKASQTPKVDPVYTGDKNVKVVDPTVADPKAKTIKVKVGDNDSMTVEKQPDGSWKVKEDPNKEVKVEDGKIVVPLDPSAKKGDVIKVSTINDSGKASPEAKVTVEDKAATKKPTINRANKDENTVSGTAAQKAEVTVTVTPKVGEPKTFTGKADGDGNFKVTTDPLVDGDTVIVKASEPGKADNTSDPKVVGVDTSKLKDSIDKAEVIGGTDGKDLKPNENKVDKELKEALDKAKEVKEKGDNGDPNTDQKAVDKAKEDLDKAIAQKVADTAVDKAKDNPTPENIKDAQDKIDAIPGSTDPSASDHNPIKKELQDKLDLIKIIKEAEKETKKEGYKDKPTQDKTALEKAIEDGKENLKNNTKITESTNTIQEKLNIIRMERIVVGVDSLSVGIKTLKIKTSVPGATVKIKIGGVLIDTIKTDAYGTFSKGLEAEIQEDQEIVLEASKPGYNDGIFNDTVY